jgi:iron(III) transport system substrate-binding protein
MAYPLLGTSAAYVGALYAKMGQDRSERLLRDLKNNDILIVAGNSVVRDVVAAGEVPLGITDTDDVYVAIQYNKPVAMIYPDQQGIGTFLIPNTVALLRDCPHPKNGQKLIDFLLSREVEGLLAAGTSHNIPVRGNVGQQGGNITFDDLKIMDIQYTEAAASIVKSDQFCRTLFAE